MTDKQGSAIFFLIGFLFMFIVAALAVLSFRGQGRETAPANDVSGGVRLTEEEQSVPEPPLRGAGEVAENYRKRILDLIENVSGTEQITKEALDNIKEQLFSIRVPKDARDDHLKAVLRVRGLDNNESQSREKLLELLSALLIGGKNGNK